VKKEKRAMTIFEISIVIILVVLAAVFVSVFLKYKAAGSERRMIRMMKRVGLNPEIASQGDTETIVREIRRRCRKCQAEDPCEQWLEGKFEGDNSFCPNAPIFKILKEKAELAA
jgi:hypothetical protein